VHEDVAYLPWSPLGTGILSGKYLNGQVPEGTRWSFAQRHGLFRDTPKTHQTVAALVQVAKDHNISPVKLALGWVDQVDGVTSTIIGATKLTQLEQNIAAFAEPLSTAVLADIDGVLRQMNAAF